MKNLKDFEEEIYKCSRCGLCQSVCPVYKASGNECAVSRGKFNILNGIIKGDLSFSKKVKSYLDMCTGCNACKNFCPSQIDAKQIFVAAKSEYYKLTDLTMVERLFNSYLLFKILLVTTGFFCSLYRFFRIHNMVQFFEPLILKFGILGKRLILFDSLANKTYKNEMIEHQRSVRKEIKRALYFDGCFNKYINNQTKNSVIKILKDAGLEFIKKDFDCCGVSYLYDGNIEYFKNLAIKNLKKFDDNIDFIITDCSSCYDVLKDYKNYIETESAQNFSSKVFLVTDFIRNVEFVSQKFFKVAVHKPCHDSYDFIDIIKKIKNIEYTETKDFDSCCGFSGKFAVQNQEISREISRQKAQIYVDSKVDIILTTCPACVLGLNQGLAEIQTESKPMVMNLFVFLAKYCDKV